VLFLFCWEGGGCHCWGYDLGAIGEAVDCFVLGCY
jgi:hypothetical protein